MCATHGNISPEAQVTTGCWHHGMVMVGLPYSEPDLAKTSSGGTPYGASHVSGHDGGMAISDEESRLCIALGKRVAEMATRLNS